MKKREREKEREGRKEEKRKKKRKKTVRSLASLGTRLPAQKCAPGLCQHAWLTASGTLSPQGLKDRFVIDSISAALLVQCLESEVLQNNKAKPLSSLIHARSCVISHRCEPHSLPLLSAWWKWVWQMDKTYKMTSTVKLAHGLLEHRLGHCSFPAPPSI